MQTKQWLYKWTGNYIFGTKFVSEEIDENLYNNMFQYLNTTLLQVGSLLETRFIKNNINAQNK